MHEMITRLPLEGTMLLEYVQVPMDNKWAFVSVGTNVGARQKTKLKQDKSNSMPNLY